MSKRVRVRERDREGEREIEREKIMMGYKVGKEELRKHTQWQRDEVTVESYQVETRICLYWEHIHTQTIYGMTCVCLCACVCVCVCVCVCQCVCIYIPGH